MVLTVKTFSKNMSSSPLSARFYHSHQLYSNKINSLKINIDCKDKLLQLPMEMKDFNRAFDSLQLSTFEKPTESVRRTSRTITCPSPPRPYNSTNYCWSHINK